MAEVHLPDPQASFATTDADSAPACDPVACTQKYVNHKVQQAKNQVHDAVKRDNRRRPAGEHHWPWEVQPHDDEWIDAHVPTFLGGRRARAVASPAYSPPQTAHA